MTDVPSPASGWRARAEQALAPWRDDPAAWALGLDRLRAADRPDAFTWVAWEELLNGAAAFVDRWGERAHAEGWTGRELFSLHRVAPLHRVEHRGAAFMIGRGQVLDVTATALRLRPAWSRLEMVVPRRWCVGEQAAWEDLPAASGSPLKAIAHA